VPAGLLLACCCCILASEKGMYPKLNNGPRTGTVTPVFGRPISTFRQQQEVYKSNGLMDWRLTTRRDAAGANIIVNIKGD
jgi:hypothetical protein